METNTDNFADGLGLIIAFVIVFVLAGLAELIEYLIK